MQFRVNVTIFNYYFLKSLQCCYTTSICKIPALHGKQIFLRTDRVCVDKKKKKQEVVNNFFATKRESELFTPSI